MIVKLLTEHHLEFLTLKGGCTGSSESTHLKMPHCRKSHALAHMIYIYIYLLKDNKHYMNGKTIYICYGVDFCLCLF